MIVSRCEIHPVDRLLAFIHSDDRIAHNVPDADCSLGRPESDSSSGLIHGKVVDDPVDLSVGDESASCEVPQLDPGTRSGSGDPPALGIYHDGQDFLVGSSQLDSAVLTVEAPSLDGSVVVAGHDPTGVGGKAQVPRNAEVRTDFRFEIIVVKVV